ncbi:MAG TPA: alcohol dehydrogenase catalytic domain-containing protein, partial [Aestuariivirga sp.]|nr:alcohol dehydrogenase catalytic domain-containing protein [Aestuariivirga sp.]
MKAIRISATGSPDVMQWEEVKLTPPGTGEVRLRHTAVGLNYIDTYHRSGLYALPLPMGLGLEAAGVIEAVGEGVKGFKVGNRVAYGTGPIGAYAEARKLLIELGALDNRTGSQQVTSRVRLTDQLYLIGDIGTEGGFTGRLKYLI